MKRGAKIALLAFSTIGISACAVDPLPFPTEDNSVQKDLTAPNSTAIIVSSLSVDSDEQAVAILGFQGATQGMGTIHAASDGVNVEATTQENGSFAIRISAKAGGRVELRFTPEDGEISNAITLEVREHLTTGGGTDGTDGTDSTDGTDGTDSTDVSDSTDGTDGTDGTEEDPLGPTHLADSGEPSMTWEETKELSIKGPPGFMKEGERLLIANITAGLSFDTLVNADGSFDTQILAVPGDSLMLFAESPDQSSTSPALLHHAPNADNSPWEAQEPGTE